MIMEKLQDDGKVSLDVDYRGIGDHVGDRKGGKSGGKRSEYRPFDESRSAPIDGGGKGGGMDRRDFREHREPRDYRDHRDPPAYPPPPPPAQGDLTTYDC